VKNTKKIKKKIVNDELLEKILCLNPLWVLPKNFGTPFQANFIFGASQLELSIKSHDHLKFFSF